MVSDVVVNEKEAVERLGDRDIYLEISRFFAERLPASLEELRGAVEQAEFADATRFAHSLKGASASVGADGVREVCSRLEIACRAENSASAEEILRELAPQLAVLREKLLAL